MNTYKITPLSQFVNEVRQMSIADISRAWYRLLSLYITSSAYKRAVREMAKEARNKPRHMFEYLGYGIYVGRK